ncbi:Ig-like domain-containing protein, partial [Robinsoniella sp.]|uniref:Ig-like domain-containing protein n=1 Tax=Robinsoniella sp. TaxID=2496533 RepID=UPI0037525531
HPGFGPEKMLDGDDALDSRLATKRGVEEVPIEISLTGEKTFNTLVIKEGLGPITGETLTAQIKGYEIQAFKNGAYESLMSARDEASGIVGEKLTIDLGQDVTASKVRVIFKVNPTAGINIKEAELYRLGKPQPYVNETARDVVSYLGIPERLELTDTHLPVSEMPGAYSPRIIASSNPDIIALDGTVAREDADQTVTVLMEVTKRKGTNTILEKAVMPYTVVVAGLKIPAVTCQVTFHGNGGAVPNPASKEVLAGEAIGNLPETTREGYEFLGWFTAQTGGTKVTEETVVYSSMDLYARWREITVQQPQQPQKPHPEVSFAKKEYSLYATQTVKTSVNANAAAGAVTGYQSSNTRVAVVTSGGVIKGIKKGTATITVSTSGKGTASVKVTVKTPKVTLTAKNAKLQEGKTTKAITVSRKIKTDKIVKFTSSKKKIASVNRKGRIKGIKAGKTKITVFMKSGAKASCILTVQKAPVKTTKIRVPKKIILKVNKKQKIDVVRKPVTSADKIHFRSSNSKIAKVGKKGVITAKKAGSCNITVTCNKISKKIRVIVERK